MINRREVSRWSVLVLVASALGGILWSRTAQQKQDEDYTIRTTSRLVLLDVSVKDPAGGFVSGLTKDNFKIYEDGKQQQLTQFGGADQPVTVGIVVDESGSMGPKRAEAIAAALEFIKASNPRDEIFVVNFNEKARRGLPDMVPFSDNIEQLSKALWRGLPEGRTALYDAVELSLSQMKMGRRDRKAMIVISDGGDNVSVHKWPDVMHDVLDSLVTIYTVGIFDEEDAERDPRVLEKLAHVSGGAAYFPKTIEEVVPVCRQIAKDVRERYTVGYIPPMEGKPVRHVKVDAFTEDHKKLVIRTRNSYMFEPDTEAVNRK
jgi:Ca-activated chloride channel family protein